MLKEVYQHITDLCLDTGEVKHAALWNQQLAFIDEEEPFDLPAAFVEIGTIENRTLAKPTAAGKKRYALRAPLTIHLLTNAAEGNDRTLDLADRILRQVGDLFCEDGRLCVCTKEGTEAVTPCHDHAEVVETLVGATLHIDFIS